MQFQGVTGLEMERSWTGGSVVNSSLSPTARCTPKERFLVCLCLLVYMCMQVPVRSEDLESQAAVSCQMWLLGIDLRSSGRASCACRSHNHCAISLVPPAVFNNKGLGFDLRKALKMNL